MTNVGMFYFSSIYEKTGAGKVARSFYEEGKLLKHNGVDNLYIYSLSSILDKSGKKGKQDIVKQILKKVLEKFYLGNCFLIKNTYFKNGKRALKTYLCNSKNDEDILLFHELYSCYAYLSYCKKNSIAPLKYVLVEHTNGDTWKMLKIYYPKIIGTKFEKYLCEVSDLCETNASKIVFVSSKSAEKYISLRPDKKEKIEVIPNGIKNRDCPIVKRNYDKLELVTVGTVNERKNQQMIIECLSEIGDQSITLKIVGDGPSLDYCKELVQKRGVTNQVLFMGARDDVESILDESNVFIMSSYDEGLPIAGIEALKSGLPLIMTDVGGCDELIENNGILVNPQKDSLVKAIKAMRSNDTETNIELGKASYDLFQKKYTIDSMMRSYCRLFNKCTESLEK